MRELSVEVNSSFVGSNDAIKLDEYTWLVFTPAIDEYYWLFRVKLFEDQAIVGFPKFNTVGIGFSQEDYWNVNLPYTCETEQIFKHINRNKKYRQIPDGECIEAIRLIQNAVKILG